MGALETLFESIDTKLKTASFITDTANVVFGEDYDLMGNEDSMFPRIETVVVKLKCNGYADQRNLEWSLRLGSGIHVRISPTVTPTPHYTVAEAQTLAAYGKEVADLYFSFLDDKQSGSPPCDGFEMLGSFPEIFFEKELIPKTMSAVVFTEINLLLADTETL